MNKCLGMCSIQKKSEWENIWGIEVVGLGE